MAKRSRKPVLYHSFYCINCGKKVYDLPRNKGCLHKKFHRKKLYCIYCHQEINHVECRNDAEVFEFKEQFREGVFNDECKESISFMRSSGFREEYMGL